MHETPSGGAGCLLVDAYGGLRVVCATDAPTRALAAAETATGEGPGHEALVGDGELLGPVSLRSRPHLAELLPDSSIETVVVAPVVRASAPIGVVVTVADQAAPWSSEGIDTTGALAGQVGRQLGEALSHALAARRRRRSEGEPGVEPVDDDDDRDSGVIGQLLTALDNRQELDRAGSIIAGQAGSSVLRARRRLRQLAEGMDVPAITIARRIIAHGRLPHPHEFLAEASVRSHREELARLALIDPLTGLANRVLLLDRLQHDVGDHVLRTVASRIQAAIRPQDTVGRMGGDEFAVICEAVDGTPSAVAIARRIAGAVEEPIALDELGGSRSRSLPAKPIVGASIGIAVAAPGQSAEEVLRAADTAMYRSKSGPGPIAVEDQPVARPRQSSSR